MNQKITLLDLGGVVFQSTGTSNHLIKWDVIGKLNHKYGHDLNVGKGVFPDFMREYNELTGLNLTGEKFLEFVFDTLKMNTELVEMIQEFSDIIIVSDNYRENIAYISKRYAFDSWAEKQVYSFDYMMEKSNPLFFKQLLEELGDYKTEDLLFIDDSPRKIESAAASGIRGILFTSNDAVRDELKKVDR